MSDPSLVQAVIRGEPDGYDMAKPGLMGRQSAGHGFLRAAVQSRGDRPIYGFSPGRALADGFRAIVGGIDPAADFEWISPDRLSRIADVGVLYIADATVPTYARLRQRTGVAAFSICGVTHTTASLGAMDEIGGLLREAVMPWDALVCTSSSVVETVRRIHEAERDYFRWRFGVENRAEAPQLPIIPLGVHCDDYAFDAGARDDARQALGLEPDEVAALFVGRLVFHAKAHPYPMYRALQLAAERTGQRIVLILSGWAPNDTIAAAFRTGAEQFAPDVRVLFVEGRDPTLRAQAWAASDLFISLSDNIQETFGLTPIEAMAAGLPVIVSDWDGYRDTVRHTVDGFRVRTLAPADGMGVALARGAESRALSYDLYCWATASAIAVDIAEAAEAVTALVQNPDLRRTMGEAGRRRAREVYDWPVVYRQYQALWAELNARRATALADPETRRWIESAPNVAPSRMDPFHAFGHYPSATIDGQTRLSLAPSATIADLRGALAHPLFGSLFVEHRSIEALFALIQAGEVTLAEAAATLGATLPPTTRAAGLLLKMGLACLTDDQPFSSAIEMRI